MSYEEEKKEAMESMEAELHMEQGLRELFERGFDAGYMAGLDRGMEVEHEVQYELQREGMPFSYDD